MSQDGTHYKARNRRMGGEMASSVEISSLRWWEKNIRNTHPNDVSKI